MNREQRRKLSKTKLYKEGISPKLEKLKSNYEALVKKHGLTDGEIEKELNLPKNSIQKAFKNDNISFISEMLEEFNQIYGIANVRKEFKTCIYYKGFTMTELSKAVFPLKSDNYLATVLNENNRDTYPYRAVFEIFEKVKTNFQKEGFPISADEFKKNIDLNSKNGRKRIDEREEKLLSNLSNDLKKTEVNYDIENQVSEDSLIINITNYQERAQKHLTISTISLKELNDFFEVLKDVKAISNDVEIKVIE